MVASLVSPRLAPFITMHTLFLEWPIFFSVLVAVDVIASGKYPLAVPYFLTGAVLLPGLVPEAALIHACAQSAGWVLLVLV